VKLSIIGFLAVLTGCATSATRSPDCAIDLGRICAAFLTAKRVELHLPGEFILAADPKHYPPAVMPVPFLYPDGKIIAMVECHFDWPRHLVTGAYLLSGQFDRDAFQYAREHNFCIGQATRKAPTVAQLAALTPFFGPSY